MSPKSAAQIKFHIIAQEKKLGILHNNLSEYKGILAELESAKAELKKIMGHYDFEFKAASSYPNKTLTMNSLGLIGVEKTQSMIADAYRGTREKSFLNSVSNMLTALQKKIISEESKITTCYKNITITKDMIASLKIELASAI